MGLFFSPSDTGPLFILASIIAIAFVSGIIYLCGLVVYRVFFHPLAQYPGPIIARITHFYGVYHAYRGDRHEDIYRCHEKYGPVFRYSPNGLSFNTSTAMKTIHGAKANCQKSKLYIAYTPLPGAWSIVNAIPKQVHARKKRILSQAFSDRAVKDMEDYILGHTEKFVRLLRDAAKTASDVDMSLHIDDLIMDIFSGLCFGKSYGIQGSKGERTAREMINTVAKHHYIMGQIPYLDRTSFDKLLIPKLTAGTAKFRAFSRASAMARAKAHEIDYKMSPSPEKKDIFSYLLTATDIKSNEGLSQPELWSEAGTLIVAGADTTSTCLASTFYYLTRPENKTCLGRLTQEVRSAFPGEDIEQIRSGPILNQCLYLRACIDEALRMSPPVPALLPREVLQGGMDIDGYHVPEGVDVGVSCYALHHNEEYFESSFNYKPHRWLEASEVIDILSKEDWDNRLLVQQQAFQPFLLGPRVCLGKNMAYMEMLSILARAVWMFDIENADKDGGVGKGENGDFKLFDQFTADRDGPILRFVARD